MNTEKKIIQSTVSVVYIFLDGVSRDSARTNVTNWGARTYGLVINDLKSKLNPTLPNVSLLTVS